MRPLEAALKYAALGWKVFPIVPETKKPRPNTKGYHDASCNPKTITDWWTQHPTYWVAIAMRPSGLIAIDADTYKDGCTITDLISKYGSIVQAPRQTTASGGHHYVFTNPDTTDGGWTDTEKKGGICRGKLGEKVDIKNNGYILAEPTPGYVWQTFPDPPPLPQGWIKALKKPEAKVLNQNVTAWQDESDGPLWREDRERLLADLRSLPSRGEGSNTTFRAILLVFHQYGLSVESGAEYIEFWNSINNKPHSQTNLNRQIRKIAEKISEDWGGRGYKRTNQLPLTEQVARAPELSNPLALKDQVIPQTEFAKELAKAEQDIYEALNDGQQINEAIPYFEPASHILNREYPATPWLVQGLLTQGAVAVGAGEPKSTKTWMCTEIAIAVATGALAFGKYKTAKGNVAYFYAEDQGTAVQNRLRALLKGKEMKDCPGLFVQPRGKNLNLADSASLAMLVASARKIPNLSLLVLDPMRDIHDGEEDSSDSMTKIMKRLKIAAILLDCTILVVHHTGKSSADSSKRRAGQNLRGSSAIHGALDCGIYLTNLKGNLQNEFINTVRSEVKGAQGAGQFKLTLNIEDNPLGTAIKAAWTCASLTAEAKEKAAREATQSQLQRDSESVLTYMVERYNKKLHTTTRETLEAIKNRLALSTSRARAALQWLKDEDRLRIMPGLGFEGVTRRDAQVLVPTALHIVPQSIDDSTSTSNTGPSSIIPHIRL